MTPIILMGVVSVFIYSYYPAQQEREAMSSIQTKIKNVSNLLSIGVGIGMGETDLVAISEAMGWATIDSSFVYISIKDTRKFEVALFNPNNLQLPKSLITKVKKNEVFEFNNIIFSTNTLIMRDFDKDDIELKNFFISEGFAPIDMPNSNVVEDMQWNSIEELIESVSARNRRHIRNEVLKSIDNFEIEYKNELTDEEAEYFYQLYINVEHKNRGFNMFDYPKDILKKLSKHPNWEFLIIKLKPEFDKRNDTKAIAVIWYYKTSTHISPMIIGIDYDYNQEFKVYKQAMYQILKRARMLGLNKVYLGLSADIEKKKYGAVQHAKVAYVQAKDNYNMEVIESMAAIPAQMI